MRPVSTPPYYAGRIYPVLINTQGGPRHDRHQRVLDPFGEPIPGLYAAGELGSGFGHGDVSGGNLAECVVGGWTAARHAAGRARSDSVGAAFSARPVYEEKAGNG
jgi:succinate dehydrogenase/fumarate reductase flavoprotein subunit